VIALARLVAAKDLRIETRRRVVLWQVLPFGLMALLVSGLAQGPTRAGHSGVGPGLFFVVMLFVTLLLVTRSQSLERSGGTRSSVAVLGLDPAGVFLGKSAAVVVELWFVGAALWAGTVLFLHVPGAGALAASPGVALALLGMATAGTLYGALAGSDGPPTLLAVLSLPAYAPFLIVGERLASATLRHGATGKWWTLLAVADAAYLALGVSLYGVVEEI
jgi:heme exporter protein B